MSFLNHIIKEEFYNPATTLGAVFYALVFLGIAWVLGRLLKFAVTRAVRHEQGLVDRMAAPFLTQLARMAAYIVLLLIYVHLVPELRSVGTALLTGVSVVSIVIGLAAQNTLGNLISLTCFEGMGSMKTLWKRSSKLSPAIAQGGSTL